MLQFTHAKQLSGAVNPKVNTMKLIQRQGNNRTYTTDKGNIEVVVCTDPNLYANTGYYIRANMSVPNEVLSRAYSTGKRAAIAAYKTM